MKDKMKYVLVMVSFGLVLYFMVGFSSARQGLPSVEERVYGVSQIWKRASDHYALWKMADTEPSWDEAYEIAYEEAVNAKTSKEYYLVLKKFLAHLHDGHAEGVSTYKGMVTKYMLPFLMEYRNSQYVIVQTANVHANKFPLGAVVKTIDGVETGKYLEEVWGEYVGLLTPGARQQQLCNLFLYAGEKGEKITVELLGPGQTETKRQTATWAEIGSKYQKQSYHINGESVYTSEAFEVKVLEEDIFYVNFRTQQDLAYIDEWFEEVTPLLAECKGIILDVRSNGGGNSMVGHTILESFVGEPIAYCSSAPDTMKVSSFVNNFAFWDSYMELAADRENPSQAEQIQRTLDHVKEMNGTEFEAMLEIGAEMYQGRFELSAEMEELLMKEIQKQYPDMAQADILEATKESAYKELVENSPLIGKNVVLLIGHNSGSATDSMAAEAKAAGFPLVGTRTKGATGNVLAIDAGGGWKVGISTQRSLTPEGIDINNIGVEADVFVEQSEQDALNHVDTQVETAVEVLLREGGGCRWRKIATG